MHTPGAILTQLDMHQQIMIYIHVRLHLIWGVYWGGGGGWDYLGQELFVLMLSKF